MTRVRAAAQFSEPLSKKHCATQHASEHVAAIYSSKDGHRPLLPLAVPVQGDGHGAQPGAEEAAQQPTKGLVERGLEPNDGSPGARIDAVGVEERESGEQGQVGGAEKGVGDMGEQGRPEEDHGGVEERRQDQREQEGEEGGLDNHMVSTAVRFVEGDPALWAWQRTMIKLGPAPSPAFFFSPGLCFLFLGEPDPAAGRHRKA